MTKDEQIKHWVTLAENDLPVAEHLFENGYYVWCLYIGHLVLEKILKAVYVRDNDKAPPKTHDLVKLAEKTKLSLSAGQKQFLKKVNNYNQETRYPEFRREAYMVYTKEYASENFDKIKEMYQWLKSQMT